MRNFVEIAEIAKEAKQVFLPNRYQKPFTEAFQELTGYEVPEVNERKAKAEADGRTYWWIRGRDVPRVVELAGAESEGVVGLTGGEWCMEYACAEPKASVTWGNMTQKRMGRVALIAPESADASQIANRLRNGFYPLGVATAYPNLVTALGMTDRYNISCQVPLSGSVEGVADAIGLPAVDLIVSGKTVEQNDFVIIEDLVDVYPALVFPGGRPL